MPDEVYDAATGELPPRERAADGGRVPPPTATVADTIRLLADGQFDADISHDLRELIRKMEAHAFGNKGRAKGKLVITLDIELANGAHVVVPSAKVTMPVAKQPGTLLFAFEDGRLSRNPPGQRQLFGVREVTSTPEQVRQV